MIIDINSVIAQRAEWLADRMLARLQTIRTPARRAQALRSALRKLRINDQAVAQVAGGVNLRRALISAYGDYIRSHAGLSTGMGTTYTEARDQAGVVLDIINDVAETAGTVGETVVGLWDSFTGGPPPPPPPAPAVIPDPAKLAPGVHRLRRMGGLRRVGADTTGVDVFGSDIGLSNIPPWILVGGAAAAAGLGYYLITSKKKK
jgi:hypothetical protein